jgi:leucyl/phenylalanyl-tRNA--protein transferase
MSYPTELQPPGLTPEMLLAAYQQAYFPMALDKDDPDIYWFCPEERGVLPIADFHIPRGLKKVLRTHRFTLRVDTCFRDVMEACAEITHARRETWINAELIDVYSQLHEMGHAHSVETWQDGTLVGGLYGVSIGGAFFGESMFSRVPEASKVALVTLVQLLEEAGYTLLDTQYVNDHLLQFGVQAISKRRYKTKLLKALNVSPNPSSRFSTISVRRGLAESASANTGR